LETQPPTPPPRIDGPPPAEPPTDSTVTAPTPTPFPPNTPGEGIYNDDLLPNITDASTALDAVQTAIDRQRPGPGLPPTIMDSPDELFDLLMFAEEAIALAASAYVDEGTIYINAQTIRELLDRARSVEAEMVSLLTRNGITPDRQLRRIVTFKTHQTKDIRVIVEPSAGHMQIDMARVLANGFGLGFTRTFIMDTVTNNDPNRRDRDFVLTDLDYYVDVSLAEGVNGIEYHPKHATALPVIIELPRNEGDIRYQTLVDLDKDERLVSINNNITGRIEGQDFTGSTIVVRSELRPIHDNFFFDDIIGQERVVVQAINQLAYQNVLEGVGGRRFNPNSVISRAEIAVVISKMMAMSRGSRSFTDVPSSHWAWDPIRRLSSSTNPVILAGTTQSTFSPDVTINKAQLTAIAGRCLSRRFNSPADPISVLRDRHGFSDYNEISRWIADIDKVALAVNTHVNYGAAGRFQPEQNMTRGQAAVILQRLYSRLGHMR
jgi:hypothetical protein